MIASKTLKQEAVVDDHFVKSNKNVGFYVNLPYCVVCDDSYDNGYIFELKTVAILLNRFHHFNIYRLCFLIDCLII
jgi:hypothetical protein